MAPTWSSTATCTCSARLRTSTRERSLETFPADREATVVSLLIAMDFAGVERAVVIPLTEDDRYVREALGAARGRLAGLGVHDPLVRTTVDQLRVGHVERLPGPSHVRARSRAPGIRPRDHPETLPVFPLLRAMAEDGLRLSMYPTAPDLPALAAVLGALPSLQVLLNHQGFCHEGAGLDEQDAGDLRTEEPPPYFDAVLALARYQNCHLMFSGHYAYSRVSG